MIVSRKYSETDRKHIRADLTDEDLQRTVMMVKELSLESIGVQPLNPPEISIGQKYDADGWALMGISFCCTGQHPPLPRLHHCYTSALVEFQSVKLRSNADEKVGQAFDRFHN